MSLNSQDAVIAGALATARVRALRLRMLGLHKAALDEERHRYERANGRIESAHAVLRLVLDDPWFQWLHPFAEVIVQMDERLAGETPMTALEAEAFANRVRTLIQGNGGDERFRTGYHRLLQESPEVVMAHAEVAKLLAGEPR